MKRAKFALTMFGAAALMLGMTFSPMAVPSANAQISIHFGWQQPPREYNNFQRQGFHAGIEAARHDIDRGMPPDYRRHRSFRHPHVPPRQRDDYRRGFRHGYEVGYQHRRDWNHHHHDWGR